MRRAPYDRKRKRLERERRDRQTDETLRNLREQSQRISAMIEEGWTFNDEGRFIPPASVLNHLRIVEGSASVWHYHLSITGENGKPALCGNTQVMQTTVPLSQWGIIGGSIRCSYCPSCSSLHAAARRT